MPKDNEDVKAKLLEGNIRFSSAATVMQNVLNDLDTIIADLDLQWLGSSYQAYTTAHTQFVKDVATARDILQKCADALKTMHDKIVEAEEEARKAEVASVVVNVVILGVLVFADAVAAVVTPLLVAADEALAETFIEMGTETLGLPSVEEEMTALGEITPVETPTAPVETTPPTVEPPTASAPDAPGTAPTTDTPSTPTTTEVPNTTPPTENTDALPTNENTGPQTPRDGSTEGYDPGTIDGYRPPREYVGPPRPEVPPRPPYKGYDPGIIDGYGSPGDYIGPPRPEVPPRPPYKGYDPGIIDGYGSPGDYIGPPRPEVPPRPPYKGYDPGIIDGYRSPGDYVGPPRPDVPPRPPGTKPATDDVYFIDGDTVYINGKPIPVYDAFPVAEPPYNGYDPGIIDGYRSPGDYIGPPRSEVPPRPTRMNPANDNPDELLFAHGTTMDTVTIAGEDGSTTTTATFWDPDGHFIMSISETTDANGVVTYSKSFEPPNP